VVVETLVIAVKLSSLRSQFRLDNFHCYKNPGPISLAMPCCMKFWYWLYDYVMFQSLIGIASMKSIALCIFEDRIC